MNDLKYNVYDSTNKRVSVVSEYNGRSNTQYKHDSNSYLGSKYFDLRKHQILNLPKYRWGYLQTENDEGGHQVDTSYLYTHNSIGYITTN